MRERILLGGCAVLFLFLQGCALRAVQSDELRKKPPAVPASHALSYVPFIEQSAGFCGPATLTMGLQAAGKLVTLAEIGPQVYTPGMRGSLQNDMIGGARRAGMMAIPIKGMDALVRELAAGNPVVVFENLAIPILPRWHYALVFGYDLTGERVLMHSGPNANLWVGFREFENDWKLGDYWGLVLFAPGKLSATATELEHLQAAAALENLKKNQEARLAYTAILGRWPTSMTARIGLGNVAFREKSFKDAVGFLKDATVAEPLNAAAWHNLALAQAAAKQAKDAKKSAAEALRLANAQERAAFEESLGKIIR